MDFQQGYNQSEFKNFLKLTFLKDNFEEKNEQLSPVRKTQFFVENEIYKIGEIQGFEKEVAILQIKQKSKNDPRITLTKDTFKLMQDYSIRNALIVFWIDDNSPWRFSLLTTNFTEDFKKELSSPKRYSYLLGPGEKTKTPERYLIKQGVVKNFEDLFSRFDVEVVRKEFFKLYVNLFLELYGEIQHNPTFNVLIQQNKIEPVSFAKNLMGKMIFLYFIQKKGWLGITDKSKPFDEGDRDFFKNNFDKLAHDADLFQKHSNFYNDFLEPLFYSGLNKKNPDDWHSTLNMKVPYLNGGLFEEEYDWKNTIINLDNQVFKNIINSFDTYNFTIDEDDPIDREIAVDPEMLGKIFESMISVSKDNIDDIMDVYRKAKEKKHIVHPNPENILNIDIGKEINKKFGAFYTPREIVHYMTKESLIAYLTNKLHEKNQNKSEEEIEGIVRKLFEYKDKHLTQQEIEAEKKDGYELLKTYVFDIQDALKTVKILDPAVGSGAFPMGILQEILGLRRYLIDTFGLQQESDFEIKKQIILNTVHGVDIDPGAIDIARLRFRLSLIVDATKPVPLPNLDFKFVCANTLIPLEQDTLFTDKETIEKLRILRNNYFSCDNHNQKEELKKEFEILKLKLSGFGQRNKAEFKTLKDWNVYIDEIVKQNADKKNRQILERDPFDTSKSNEWFDSQMMFGVDGFDIVIGNPPYIDSESMSKTGGGELREKISNLFKYTKGNWDIYIAFFEYGFHVLNNSGFLSFITPDKRTGKDFGNELRKVLLKNFVSITMAGRKVFENAKIDSIVSFISKKEKDKIIILNCEDKFNFKKIRVFDKNKLVSPFYFDILFSNCIEIINKIELNKKHLQDFGICENACATSDAYLLKPLILNEDYNDNYFKVINTGTIGKYKDRWGVKEMIYLGHKYLYPVCNKKEFKDCFKNSYGKKPEKIKIILKGLNLLDACLDDEGNIIPGKTTLIVTSDNIDSLFFLLAIINSKLIYYYIKQKYSASSYNGGISFTKHMINNIPIPQVSNDKYLMINNIINQILAKKKQDPQADTANLEHQIDQMVYELYGLTDEEIKVVEESMRDC